MLLPRFRSVHAQALCSNRSPYAYGKLVHSQLLRALSDAGGPARCAHRNARGNSSDVAAWRHLVVVNAWNEWGEQAVVEPSVQDGDEMLLAHRRAVEDVEKHVMESVTRNQRDTRMPNMHDRWLLFIGDSTCRFPFAALLTLLNGSVASGWPTHWDWNLTPVTRE